MKWNDIWALKLLADQIEHCGDYGEVYISRSARTVYIVLGDADDPRECNILPVQSFCQTYGLKLIVEAEYFPYDHEEKNRPVLISRGAEVYHERDYKADPINGDWPIVSTEKTIKPLSVEEYAELTIFARSLPKE